jgi:methylenetetrahydrofolate dehydrogenase (NADP+)/methenyltetrahydrofolate cyclohydrolase
MRLGFGHKDYNLDAHTTEDELLDLIEDLNNDSSVDGILVQLPLPKGLDEEKVIEAINPNKDVDGFHPMNTGKLLTGLDGFVSCTPNGVMAMLNYYNIETSGKHAVIVGRSNIVGKPMAALLMQKGVDATVTVCNSRTKNLENYTKTADILIAAIGKSEFITASMIKDGAVVIDVGINRVEDKSRKRGYRVCGDVNYADCESKASAMTPVPGGVGLMTIAMLMENTVKGAKINMSKDNK